MINLIKLAETQRMPDMAIRGGIRKLLRDRLKKERCDSRQEQLQQLYAFIDLISRGPVAVATDTANEQHYEVPCELFQTFMGPRLKYSSGYWPTPETALDQSEEAMLELTCARAGLADGMDILELGCGWGSLSVWMAEKYPNARITAVSNSRTQKAFIDSKGKSNLTVITADMNDFSCDRQYDRIVSVEMFEHMRNWPELFRRLSGWLKDDGRFFMHIFVHREIAYLFNDSGDVNWMTEHFFKEGMMPSESLPGMVNNDMLLERHWRVHGSHYARTLLAWLKRFDANRAQALAVLERHYDKEAAKVQFGRWRIFFMACEELFRFNNGDEWYVAHYLMKRR